MNVFELPFKVAKEVVKRNRDDNRRLITQRPDGGNNIFYLGSTDSLLEKLNDIHLLNRLRNVQALLNDDSRHPRAIQHGEGVPAIHKISKLKLQNLLNFLQAFLNQYADMYHNPNLDLNRVTAALNNLDSEFLEFESDVLFIHDNNGSKPYFKWFNKKTTASNWKLFQEFLIPELSFLNFEYLGYEEGVMRFEWDLNYAPTVIMSSDNIEEIIINSVQHVIPSYEERETIKEAITKIRIGQSQFRRNLILSKRNTCVFTKISDPQILIASHIKAWKDSNNSERLNINNGLLLSPTFDKLFDKYLITFNEDGSVRWSMHRLDENTIELLRSGITLKEEVFIEITNENKEFIDHHRHRFLELEKSE